MKTLSGSARLFAFSLLAISAIGCFPKTETIHFTYPPDNSVHSETVFYLSNEENVHKIESQFKITERQAFDIMEKHLEADNPPDNYDLMQLTGVTSTDYIFFEQSKWAASSWNGYSVNGFTGTCRWRKEAR